MINLEIMPNKITNKEWEHVYEETLELIEAYPFMDKIIIEEKYDTTWIYADRTRERKLHPWYDDFGWYVIGDMKTGEHAENFALMRNLDFYRHDDSGKVGDIFLSTIAWRDDMADEIKNKKYSSRTVFNSKTQGYDYHKYILAIACLIEGRFPESAVVTGDITIGQMREAIAWADKILEKPIPLTDRADREGLLGRLKKSLQSEYALLQSFMELNLTEHDECLGDLLRSNFSKGVVKKYVINYFSNFLPGTIGFGNSIENYFNLGFDLGTLCEVCVTDKNGCCKDEDGFIEAVLNSGLNNNEQLRHDVPELAVNDPESKKPDTVDTMVNKTFFSLALGKERTTTKYLSLQEIKEVFIRKFNKPEGYYQRFIEKVFAKKEESGSTETDSKFSELMELLQKKATETEEEIELYDIFRLSDLYLWKPECKVSPSVEKSLKRLKSFMEDLLEKKSYTDFAKLSSFDKLNYLNKQNKYFLIRKEVWDYIADQVENIDILKKIYILLNVKADEMSANNLCKMVFWNIGLLRNYFLNCESDR
ncbi:MAG: hypothetical protein PF693_20640 [Spirochaetia bacterium]|jgi:hypothetical protein|nr:hypothetical protein [Spirochaetia bacterium]